MINFSCSISKKLVQLKEGGLIKYYIQNEFDKAGKLKQSKTISVSNLV